MMKFAKKSDIIIISLFTLTCLILWGFFGGLLGKSEGKKAEIYYKSQLVKTVALTEGHEESFYIEDVPNVIFYLYADGSIAIIESDCPDQVCVRSGRLRTSGQMAACLPNQLYVKIVGDSHKNDNGPDIIIG